MSRVFRLRHALALTQHKYCRVVGLDDGISGFLLGRRGLAISVGRCAMPFLFWE